MSAAGGGTSRRPASTHLQEKAADLGLRKVSGFQSANYEEDYKSL